MTTRGTHQKEPAGVDPGAAALLVAVAGSSFGFVALARWSAWWPHSDNRQNVATVAMFLAGLIAVGSATWALLRQRRPVVVAVLTLAVLLGATVGFSVLANATRDAKGGSGGGSPQPIPADGGPSVITTAPQTPPG